MNARTSRLTKTTALVVEHVEKAYKEKNLMKEKAKSGVNKKQSSNYTQLPNNNSGGCERWKKYDNRSSTSLLNLTFAPPLSPAELKELIDGNDNTGWVYIKG